MYSRVKPIELIVFPEFDLQPDIFSRNLKNVYRYY